MTITFPNMVHVKLILDTRRIKADGTYPVIYRITQHKKVFTIASGISLETHYWDAQRGKVLKEQPNASAMNTLLAKGLYKLQQIIFKLDDRDELTIDELKSVFQGKTAPISNHTFQSFSEKLIQEMLDVKRTGNAIVYHTAVNRLLNYTGNVNLKFSEITYTMLEDFRHHLTRQGRSINTIGNYFRSIRAIYNKAIKAKLIDRSHYPFLDIKIRTAKTVKRAVLRADIQGLEKLHFESNSPHQTALNHFLLSFYLIGISFTDLAYLKPENIIDGRLVYKRRKTHKHYSIKIFPQVTAILNQYRNANSKYLLPVLPNHIIEDSLEAKKLIHQWIKTTNKYLKRIGVEAGIAGTLTTYVARHTFATTAKKLGYSNELIAEALGHEYGNRITNIYLDSFDKEVVDEMHKRVIS